MIELEWCSRVQPSHECRHQCTIVVVQVVHRRAIEGLGGDLGLQAVERTVGVHDQQMERVALRMVRRGDAVDIAVWDAVRGEVRSRFEERVETTWVDAVGPITAC